MGGQSRIREGGSVLCLFVFLLWGEEDGSVIRKLPVASDAQELVKALVFEEFDGIGKVAGRVERAQEVGREVVEGERHDEVYGVFGDWGVVTAGWCGALLGSGEMRG